MSKYINRLEAGIFKSQPLNGKNKKRPESSDVDVKTTHFTALQRVLSHKMVSKILQGVQNKGGRLSQKDAKELLAGLGPQVLSAVLVDLGLLPKGQQSGITRQLASVLPTKK